VLGGRGYYYFFTNQNGFHKMTFEQFVKDQFRPHGASTLRAEAALDRYRRQTSTSLRGAGGRVAGITFAAVPEQPAEQPQAELAPATLEQPKDYVAGKRKINERLNDEARGFTKAGRRK
jgi:hypothetical protein